MLLHSKYSIIIAKNKGQDAIACTLPVGVQYILDKEKKRVEG